LQHDETTAPHRYKIKPLQRHEIAMPRRRDVAQSRLDTGMTSQWRSIPTSKTRTIETLQYRSIEKSVAQRREIALRTDFHVMRRGHSTPYGQNIRSH
jgi:hypothetical protein